jgi:hypothetical protein
MNEDNEIAVLKRKVEYLESKWRSDLREVTGIVRNIFLLLLIGGILGYPMYKYIAASEIPEYCYVRSGTYVGDVYVVNAVHGVYLNGVANIYEREVARFLNYSAALDRKQELAVKYKNKGVGYQTSTQWSEKIRNVFMLYGSVEWRVDPLLGRALIYEAIFKRASKLKCEIRTELWK